MARPPSGTDRKLKAAGRRLLQEKGLTGFTLREACRMAGVNPALSGYYFGSKEEFLREIMKELYAEFMSGFKVVVSSHGDPRARLKSALIEAGKFAISIRKSLPMVFSDLAHGKREAFEFFSGNFTEHVRLIAELAAECRPASAVKARSVPFMVASVIPVMVFPVLMGIVLERNGVKSVGGQALEDLRGELFSEAGLAERAEIALRGLGL